MAVVEAEEEFFEARDWEREVEKLKGKLDVAIKRASALQKEVVEWKTDLENERKDKIRLLKANHRLEDGHKELREDFHAIIRVKNNLQEEVIGGRKELQLQKEKSIWCEDRILGLEKHLLECRNEIERRKCDLQKEMEKNEWLERRVTEYEREISEHKVRNDEQQTIIRQWERKNEEEKERAKRRRDIREKIEYEELVREEILTKRRKMY